MAGGLDFCVPGSEGLKVLGLENPLGLEGAGGLLC